MNAMCKRPPTRMPRWSGAVSPMTAPASTPARAVTAATYPHQRRSSVGVRRRQSRSAHHGGGHRQDAAGADSPGPARHDHFDQTPVPAVRTFACVEQPVDAGVADLPGARSLDGHAAGGAVEAVQHATMRHQHHGLAGMRVGQPGRGVYAAPVEGGVSQNPQKFPSSVTTTNQQAAQWHQQPPSGAGG